jgi:hypothetical protein
MYDEQQALRNFKRALQKLRRLQKQGIVVAGQRELLDAAQAAAEYAHNRRMAIEKSERI